MTAGDVDLDLTRLTATLRRAAGRFDELRRRFTALTATMTTLSHLLEPTEALDAWENEGGALAMSESEETK